MSLCNIVNSVNKIKRLFRKYGTSNVKEAFLFEVSILFLKMFIHNEDLTFLSFTLAQTADFPDIKLFILVGLGRSFFVCCLAHRGSTVGFLLLQCSSDVVRHPRDLRVSVATRSCRVLIFASS